jgi:hypothetical protein
MCIADVNPCDKMTLLQRGTRRWGRRRSAAGRALSSSERRLEIIPACQASKVAHSHMDHDGLGNPPPCITSDTDSDTSEVLRFEEPRANSLPPGVQAVLECCHATILGPDSGVQEHALHIIREQVSHLALLSGVSCRHACMCAACSARP